MSIMFIPIICSASWVHPDFEYFRCNVRYWPGQMAHTITILRTQNPDEPLLSLQSRKYHVLLPIRTSRTRYGVCGHAVNERRCARRRNFEKELAILEKFLGTWDSKYVGLEKLSAEFTCERILGGRYIQRSGKISADIERQILELMTYDPGEKCYRMWTHSSDLRMPTIEHRGTWDNVTQTMTWEAQFKSGATRTTRIKFESEAMMKSTISRKDPEGKLREESVTEIVTTRRQKP